jgi:hypothetical protein
VPIHHVGFAAWLDVVAIVEGDLQKVSIFDSVVSSRRRRLRC